MYHQGHNIIHNFFLFLYHNRLENAYVNQVMKEIAASENVWMDSLALTVSMSASVHLIPNAIISTATVLEIALPVGQARDVKSVCITKNINPL